MRALIFIVEQEQNPLDRVDRVLSDVVHAQLDGTPTEYREALDSALASNVALARLARSEYHPEPIVRRFLSEVRRRLSNVN
jgi:hypothetical protein